jgi:linoleoyl-CoA desaturase
LKDKHIHIARDSDLLAALYRQVEEQLVVDDRAFYAKLLAKFIFYFSITACLYSLLYIVENTFLFVLCFVMYGFASLLFAFNFAHDFAHNTIFKSKKWNNLCFIFAYTMVGAHAEAWKQRHIHAHHYAPNVEGHDSDLSITHLIRVIPGSEYFWFHRFQPIYAPLAYTTYSLFWLFVKDFVILFSKDEYTKKKGLRYHLSFWAQKIVYITYLLLLPLLLSQQSGYVVLTGFLLMHGLQSLFLLFTFFMTHHVEATEYPTTDENGYIRASWLMNQVKSSNDMHPFSETANFILGGFNNHIAHHLFPHYHHIHYPKLNRILYGVLTENGIRPNQTTYWGGVVSHLRLLKRMSCAERS